jgi:hypothetical protein
LESLRAELPGYMGGAVLFDQSILCTHLDEDLLKFVLYKNQILTEHTLAITQDSSPQIRPMEELVEEWININPETKQLRSQLTLDMLNEEENLKPVTNLSHAEIYSRVRKYIVFGTDDRIALFPAFMLKSKIET